MKVSIVVTVLNEERNIKLLLDSISKQTLKPDEVIIVDGGSTDATASVISNSSLKTLFVSKIGNRAVGRNEGIKRARNEVIAITDAGCILDKNWLREITRPFSDQKVKIVSGYYEIKAESVFERCLGVYTLVMQDNIDEKSFLPSARSMAIKKKLWKEVGGFPKEFSLNEDYVFAKRVKKLEEKIYFSKRAIVYWIPRKTLNEAFIMFYKFAKGDVQAGIFRPKVVLIFFRYLIGISLLIIFLETHSTLILFIIISFFAFYILWAINKNYKYVNKTEALFLLPVLQFSSDAAVMSGSVFGFIERIAFLKNK